MMRFVFLILVLLFGDLTELSAQTVVSATPPSQETIGTKLRRLAVGAAISNPLVNPPWSTPPAWATSAAYYQSSVVAVNGAWFVEMASTCTSASSGAGPTATTGTISDGTCNWSYIGGPGITTNDPNAPTVSVTGSTPSGLTNWYGAIGYNNSGTPYTTAPWTLHGCYGITYSTTYQKLAAFNQTSGVPNAYGCALGFVTDAGNFAVGFTNGSPPVRVIVDGRYVNPNALSTATGTPNWLQVNFTSSLKQRHRVQIEFVTNNEPNFAGVRVGPYDQVFPEPSQDQLTAVIVSDSLMSGSTAGPFLDGGTALQQICFWLGITNCWNMSNGGTGYIANNSGADYTYGARIADTGNLATIATANLVMFMGSTNDVNSTQSTITAAALADFQAVRAANPSATIIVFGVWSINLTGGLTIAQMESAVQSAVTSFADANTYFIPLYGATPCPIITGSWDNANCTGSTNATQYIFTDNIHPYDIGTAYEGWWVANAIRNSVYPLLK